MSGWNARPIVAFIVAATCLASVLHYVGETHYRGLVSSAHSQPAPIRRLIEWLRSLTLPAGIVRAEGRIEATQVDVVSNYAGEVVVVAVEEGDKVAEGQVIARLRSLELEAQLQTAELDLRSAKDAREEDAAKAAEANVARIKSMISGLTLVSPRAGKVQYRLAHAGDSVTAGASIVTLIDLADVYMTVFLRAADAGKLGIGDQARLILDAAPDYVVPAEVSFVASNAKTGLEAGETKEEPASLMLRVDLKIDPKVVETYYGKVETGLRGAGFVRTKPDAKWPADLLVKLPPAPIPQEPSPTWAPVVQEGASGSGPIGAASTPPEPGAAPALAAAPAPVGEASTSEPAAQAPTPSAPASPPAATKAPLAQEAKPTPPLPTTPAPLPPAAAHTPAAQASSSARLGPKPGAEIAPESFAQLMGAWAGSAADCHKLFQRQGRVVAYRQPVDQFAQAAIIESQRIRLPTGLCRLERASQEGRALKVSGECQDSISYTSRTAYVKMKSENEIVFSSSSDPALDTSMTRCSL